MGNNSFILTEEEKKRIKKLHEATSASASGSYNQPMAFTEPVDIEIETTFIDGDNLQDGSEEITLGIEDITNFLDMTEEGDKERIRELHKKAYIIKEMDAVQTLPKLPEGCEDCLKAAIGEKYKKKANTIIIAINKFMSKGTTPTIEDLTVILKDVDLMDAFTIGGNILECKMCIK
tara:strand:- start:158 stop:685 length:528 start_codon:yes stop_codon:yes gene_type:complete